MSFVKSHVEKSFGAHGYAVVTVEGDRHGIVQGDGLRVLVDVDLPQLAAKFGTTVDMEPDKLLLSVFGGSVSLKSDISLSEPFLDFIKDDLEQLYYKVQKEVDTYYAAGDPDDADWSDAFSAYVGTIDTFQAKLPDETPITIRVDQIADESYSPYDDEDFDQRRVDGVLQGHVCHGTIMVSYFLRDRHWSRMIAGKESSLCWSAENAKAEAIAVAAEIVNSVETDYADEISDMLLARAVELGYKSEVTPPPLVR